MTAKIILSVALFSCFVGCAHMQYNNRGLLDGLLGGLLGSGNQNDGMNYGGQQMQPPFGQMMNGRGPMGGQSGGFQQMMSQIPQQMFRNFMGPNGQPGMGYGGQMNPMGQMMNQGYNGMQGGGPYGGGQGGQGMYGGSSNGGGPLGSLTSGLTSQLGQSLPQLSSLTSGLQRTLSNIAPSVG